MCQLSYAAELTSTSTTRTFSSDKRAASHSGSTSTFARCARTAGRLMACVLVVIVSSMGPSSTPTLYDDNVVAALAQPWRPRGGAARSAQFMPGEFTGPYQLLGSVDLYPAQHVFPAHRLQEIGMVGGHMPAQR